MRSSSRVALMASMMLGSLSRPSVNGERVAHIDARDRTLPPRDTNGKPYIGRGVARGLGKFFSRMGYLRNSERNLTTTDIDRIGAAQAKRARRAAKVLAHKGITAYNGPTSRNAIDEVLNRGW